MKKLLTCMMAVVMVTFMAIPSLAANLDANKQTILDAANQTVSVGGKVIGLTAAQKTQAENYLRRDDVIISEAQAAAVTEQISKVIHVIQSSGVDSLNKLSSSDKAEILSYAQVAADAVNLTISVNSASRTITIRDKSGNIVATFDSPIKTTGTDVTPALVAISFCLILLAGCVAVAYKTKEGAK